MFMEITILKKGDMATVIAIFEDQYQNNKPLTVVKPGTQTRRFTHISDTIDVCFKAWKKINASITLFHQIKITQLYKLQKCLVVQLDFCLRGEEKDMHLF